MKWLLALLLLAPGCKDRCEPARSYESMAREWAGQLKLSNVAVVCRDDDLANCYAVCDVTYEQGSYRAISVVRCRAETGTCYAVR